MKTVVITDGKYRASIAAARVLGRAGYRVVITQTRGDVSLDPPVFFSRFVAEARWVDGSCADAEYASRLLALLREYDRPVLLCVGAVTLNTVSRQKDVFSEICDFLIAAPSVLDALNDKDAVHARCGELGIPVPKQYEGEPERYPVVIKPRCGEKFGLKAADRYTVAHNRTEYEAALEKMRSYDPSPLVQDKIEGTGAGASMLLDSEGRLISALCHRRIREYPVTGGPSTCCESFYDETMVDQAYRLLRSFGFVGMAMVEFKGDSVLEVNPRIWGSFPMTECAESPYACHYARAAAGETLSYTPCDYKTGVRMRFLLNDAVATLHYLRRGKLRMFFGGVADLFRTKEALSAPDDPAPMRRYLRQYLLRR